MQQQHIDLTSIVTIYLPGMQGLFSECTKAPHSVADWHIVVRLQVLGTLILWVGWYGFNAGSTGCMYGCMHVAAAIAVNTTLAAAAGGLTGITLHASLGYPGDIAPVLNGILAGVKSHAATAAPM